MSNVHDWHDLYLELRHRAETMRGRVELDADDSSSARCPRTIGADVIAVAAVVDPHVRRCGSARLHQRWQACMHQAWQHALAAPGETYRDNSEFWNVLLAAFVYLASIEAPLPDLAIWDALMTDLGQVFALRNAGPRGYAPFSSSGTVKTFHELYMAQDKHLRELRGADIRKPEPGMMGPERPIARTTNADVVLLADYWSKQLASVKEVFGHAGVTKKWRAALLDVDQIARKGDPVAPYAKNNGFWRALNTIATHVSVADEAPSKWDIAFDAFADGVKKLPETLTTSVKTVAGGAADLASGLALGVGKVANSAGKGLLSGFGMPLLVGGGLVGLFLISRARKREG